MTMKFRAAVPALKTAVVAVGLLMPVLLVPALLMPAAAHAQAAGVRNVSGTVADKAGTKIKGAVVHLKDTKSLSQRTYITSDDGQYKFGGLSTNTDYEIWADLASTGKKTDSKTLSSFDNKTAATVDLKMPN